MSTQKTFFTSDTHFFHDNIIRLSKRPFVNMDAMISTIVENWNAAVGKGDIVYHLGDVFLTWGKRDQDKVNSMLAALNGQKFLIIGNHDRDEAITSKHFVWARHYHEIKVDFGDVHKQRIVMCHYPMRSWNQMGRGAWMLYGHCHGNLPWHPGKSMDIGVDSNRFAPLEVHDIKKIMDKRPIFTEDHHGDN